MQVDQKWFIRPVCPSTILCANTVLSIGPKLPPESPVPKVSAVADTLSQHGFEPLGSHQQTLGLSGGGGGGGGIGGGGGNGLVPQRQTRSTVALFASQFDIGGTFLNPRQSPRFGSDGDTTNDGWSDAHQSAFLGSCSAVVLHTTPSSSKICALLLVRIAGSHVRKRAVQVAVQLSPVFPSANEGGVLLLADATKQESANIVVGGWYV